MTTRSIAVRLGAPLRGGKHELSAALPPAPYGFPAAPRVGCNAVAQFHPSGLVTLGVGEARWRLRVFGERRWRVEGGQIVGKTRPAPFEQLPITWENAFGGPESDHNPLGKGLGLDPNDPDSLRLPNVEHADQLIAHPNDRPPPACFLPVPAHFPARRRKLGSCDARWLKERWPALPDDYDPTFWDDAAPRMTLAELRGDERLTFENLHPERELSGALPGLRIRCFALDASGESPRVFELPLAPANLFIDLVEETIELGWWTPLPSELDRDLPPQLFLEEELLARDPLPAAHYEAKILAAHDQPIIIERSADPPAGSEDDEATDQVLAKALSECREALKRSGAPPELVAVLEQSEPDPDLFNAKVMQLYRVDPKDLDELRAQQKTQAREALAAHGHDPVLADALDPPREEDDRLGRQEVIDRHARGESLAGEDLTGVDLSHLDLSGADFSGTILTDANLTLANLEGCDLSEANLAGAKLLQARLTKSKLDRADLTAADLREANLAFASLVAAELAGANLGRAMLDRAVARRASFVYADLERVHAEEADLRQALFDRARLDEAFFRRADLSEASLEGARGERVDLGGATLAGARAMRSELPRADLGGSRAAGSQWRNSKLAQATLLGADLPGADLSGADLSEADLDGADLRGARIVETRLSKATLQGANLMEADLTRADLRGADLQNSNLYAAETLYSLRQGASFQGALLGGTKLAPDAPELPPEV